MPKGIYARTPAIERFEAKFITEPNSGCWLWTSYCGKSGKAEYGQFWINGETEWAHIVAFRLYRGVIPDGLELDHLCRVTICVNPRHLEPVTGLVNLMRGNGVAAINARKTHCKRGHALTEDNIYRKPGRPDHRNCITCRRNYDEHRTKSVCE